MPEYISVKSAQNDCWNTPRPLTFCQQKAKTASSPITTGQRWPKGQKTTKEWVKGDEKWKRAQKVAKIWLRIDK